MLLLRKALIGMLFLAPLLVPVRTRANWFDDWVHSLFHDGRGHHNDPHFGRNFGGPQQPFGGPGNPAATPGPGGGNGDPRGNSVPIDGGLVLLLAAGLGLGAKMSLGQKRQTGIIAVKI